MGPFSWLRRKAAEAVTLGVADGLAAVTPDGEEPPDLAGLRAMLASATAPKQLTAAPDDETPRKGRK
jgi:hypothetical protein